MDLKNYKLILSSGSPRRKWLMESTNIPFEIRTIETDESFPTEMPVEEVAVHIARNKALAHASTRSADEIILTADTIVVLDGLVLGKPKDEADAIQTLVSLSDRKHLVFTGVCLYDGHEVFSMVEKTEVTFDVITHQDAKAYYDAFNPVDKAGSYGIQDGLGITKVKSIVGSYTNILGLPVAQTIELIKSFFESK